MKTYEEMSRDVLKRRDEELIKMQSENSDIKNTESEKVRPAGTGKGKFALRIAVPCAAVLVVAAVGAGVWKNMSNRGAIAVSGTETSQTTELQPIDTVVTDSNDDALVSSVTEIDEPVNSDILNGPAISSDGVIEIGEPTTPDIAVVLSCNSEKPDFQNTNTGVNNINVLNKIPDFIVEKCPFFAEIDYSNCTFEPCSIGSFNSVSNFEIDKLGKLHTDWKEEHSDIGSYVIDTDDGEICSHEIVGVKAKYSYTIQDNCDINLNLQYGNLPADNETPSDNSECYSVVNGYKSVIYRSGDNFGAIIEINGGYMVNIYSDGLSESEFLEILDEYTK